jgi:hypothetical protein
MGIAAKTYQSENIGVLDGDVGSAVRRAFIFGARLANHIVAQRNTWLTSQYALAGEVGQHQAIAMPPNTIRRI